MERHGRAHHEHERAGGAISDEGGRDRDGGERDQCVRVRARHAVLEDVRAEQAGHMIEVDQHGACEHREDHRLARRDADREEGEQARRGIAGSSNSASTRYGMWTRQMTRSATTARHSRIVFWDERRFFIDDVRRCHELRGDP